MIWTKRLLAIAMTLSLFSASARAQQESESVTFLTSQIERFFQNLAEPTYSTPRVFQEFVAATPLEPQVSELNKLIEQYTGLQEKYGKYVDVERVDVKMIGKDVAIFRFLYKMERYPVVWYFTYYRAPTIDNTSWKLVSLKFDTRLHLLAD